MGIGHCVWRLRRIFVSHFLHVKLTDTTMEAEEPHYKGTGSVGCGWFWHSILFAPSAPMTEQETGSDNTGVNGALTVALRNPEACLHRPSY